MKEADRGENWAWLVYSSVEATQISFSGHFCAYDTDNFFLQPRTHHVCLEDWH